MQTTDRVEFLVLGKPAPKGSKKIVPLRGGGRPLLVDDNKKTKPWTRAVAQAAMVAMRGREMFVGQALGVDIVFARVRPQSHYGKRGLRPSAPIAPATKPDGDKLQRSTLDALEGVVFDNDSRIVRFEVDKVWTEPGSPPGALVRVRALGAHEAKMRAQLYQRAVQTELLGAPAALVEGA